MIDPPKDADTFIREQRQRLHERIMERFAKYGQPTLQVILQATQRASGMTQLFQRLGLTAPHNFDDQLNALTAYLNEHGKMHFLHLTGADAPKEAAVDVPPPAPAAQPEKLYDAQGRYIGPDRRAVGERRAGGDRRGNVETIWKNKRFGGDRRRTIRRACDRELAAKLGLRPNKFPPPNKNS